MPPPRPRLLVLALAALVAASVLALLLPRPAGAAERWRWPVHGTVVGRFTYTRAAPFAPGVRRGVDIASTPGVAVRAACRGRVTFAGPVPGGRGLGVTVRCGGLVATHLGLARAAVRRGARIAAGRRLGAVGPSGRVRLGARRAGDRFGYVDPLALVRGDRLPDDPALPAGRPPRGPGLPVRSVPLGRAPHAPVEGPVPPAPRVALGPRPRRAAVPGEGGVPAGAWAGLVLLAAGVPVGGVLRRRRRRSVSATPATSAAGAR